MLVLIHKQLYDVLPSANNQPFDEHLKVMRVTSGVSDLQLYFAGHFTIRVQVAPCLDSSARYD